MAVSELVKLRTDFTQGVALLCQHGRSLGYLVALNEVKRSNEQAIINAYGQLGRQHIANVLRAAAINDLAGAIVDNGAANGIRNSLHEIGLAADLLLYSQAGTYYTVAAPYTALGVWWEQHDARAAWGGRFGDAGHFSFAYQGRR